MMTKSKGLFRLVSSIVVTVIIAALFGASLALINIGQRLEVSTLGLLVAMLIFGISMAYIGSAYAVRRVYSEILSRTAQKKTYIAGNDNEETDLLTIGNVRSILAQYNDRTLRELASIHLKIQDVQKDVEHLKTDISVIKTKDVQSEVWQDALPTEYKFTKRRNAHSAQEEIIEQFFKGVNVPYEDLNRLDDLDD